MVIDLSSGTNDAPTEAMMTEAMKEMKKIRIPRRPAWDGSRSGKDQRLLENVILFLIETVFVDWRRELARLEEKYRFVHITPYEKNIEIWRQLWMVIEKSDILVQIVDCRDPQFFRCEDLEKYVHEVGTSKVNFLLLNKADLLEEGIRQAWSSYFNEKGIRHLFFSAKQQQSQIDKDAPEPETAEELNKLVNTAHIVNRKELKSILKAIVEEYRKNVGHKSAPEAEQQSTTKTADVKAETTETVKVTAVEKPESPVKPASKIRIIKTVTDAEIKDKPVIDLLDAIQKRESIVDDHECDHENDNECDHSDEHSDEGKDAEIKEKDANPVPKTIDEKEDSEDFVTDEEGEEEQDDEDKPEPDIYTRLGVDRNNIISKPFYDKRLENQVVIGMIGFPNVGKSSIINVLCNKKLVGVGSRPGKTKNFQTIFLEDNLMLCDCPGLVFPDIAHSRAQMVCNSVIPIDNAKDFMQPISLISGKMPCRVLEYVLRCPLFNDAKYIEGGRLLHVFAKNRGMISGSGMPNYAEAAKAILKRFVNGDLLCAELPPAVAKQDDAIFSQRFNPVPADYQQTTSESMHTLMDKLKYTEEGKVIENAMDDEYFQMAVDVESLLQDMTQDDVFDLVTGKQVKGVKLDKLQRREIKFAIKRDADTEEIMSLLGSFLGRGGQTFINTKKAGGQI